MKNEPKFCIYYNTTHNNGKFNFNGGSNLVEIHGGVCEVEWKKWYSLHTNPIR